MSSFTAVHTFGRGRSAIGRVPFALVVLAAFGCWLGLLSSAHAQSPQPVPGYISKRWTTADGLAHNSISALLQTRDGYLWIGTANAGLVRFDGVTFKTFDLLNSPGLPSNAIWSLHEGLDGTLWIGTWSGIASYRDGRFTAERFGHDPSHNLIFDIRTDRDGQLWAAAQGLVARRDAERWVVMPIDVHEVTSLQPARDGTIWIGTRAGLIAWRDGTARVLTARDGLPSNLVNVVREDRTGRLWIGTDAGVAYLDAHDDAVHVERAVPSVPVTHVFEDSDGVLWIGAVGRLFARTADGHVSESRVAEATEAEPGRVMAMTRDREGHVWFGIREGTGGLYRLGRQRVSTLAHEHGLPCDNVGAITQAADTTIWIATHCHDGKGLVSIRDGRLTTYSEPIHVESLLAEPGGDVWVGTFDGTLFRFDGRRFVQQPTPTADTTDAIAVIFRHQDGSLWLGTIRGLAVLRGGQWTRVRTSDGLVSDDVRAIVDGGDHSLWIGTDIGLSRYADGRFTNYTVADGVPPGPVRAIYVDAEGVVWLGTYGGGLGRFKDGKFTAFGTQGGLLDTSVHRILEDDGGFLWLTGDRGIRRVLKGDLNATADGHLSSPAVMLYSEVDGMKNVECNGMAQPAGWRARDGLLYFPTQGGMVSIDPSEAARRSLPAPLPQLEAVTVDNRQYALVPTVGVPAGYRDVEIRYTAPAFARQEQVQFRYRLEGHDQDWVDAGTRRTAHFANLRPGAYRFVVTARHGGGPWQEDAATIALVLQPYLYQRLGFQLGLVALAAVAVAAAVRWRIARLRRRAEQLEQAVADRTTELSVAHETLVTAKAEVEQAHGQVVVLLNQLDIGVLLLDATGVVRYVSASAQRLLEKDEQALMGRPWASCLSLVDTDRARVQGRIDAMSSIGGRLPVQMVSGGKRFWMELDVQDEPPPGTGRILYIYSVTEVSALPAALGIEGPHGLVGRSTAMRLLHKQVRDVARVEATVLIEGETGVGKELVARAIHRESARANRPFIAVNAAGLSESLLASQLFGHRRGAFTGAVADQVGVFEAASGGMVFLDEIGDIPHNVQLSLLRVLQEREITRIGESHARHLDVRFLAATHRDLATEVAEGRFREDLLYRIRVATIVVPPLRDRLDDLPLLVDAFLTDLARPSGRQVPEVSREAMDALRRYSWPGNVRELKSAMERALLKTSGNVVRHDDLPTEIVDRRAVAFMPVTTLDITKERDRLIKALQRAGGNRTKAAKLLGIGRTTLYRRLVAHGLDGETEA